MLVLESITTSLSFGCIVDAAGKLHSSVVEKNVVVSVSELVENLGQPPRCFTGASLLSLSLLLRPILKFWCVRTSLMRIFIFESLQAMDI